MNPYQSSEAKPLKAETNWSRIATAALCSYCVATLIYIFGVVPDLVTDGMPPERRVMAFGVYAVGCVASLSVHVYASIRQRKATE